MVFVCHECGTIYTRNHRAPVKVQYGKKPKDKDPDRERKLGLVGKIINLKVKTCSDCRIDTGVRRR